MSSCGNCSREAPMSETSAVTSNSEPAISGLPEDAASKPARRNARKTLKILGGGCLLFVVCIGAICGILAATGAFSGPKGNDDAMPAWSPDGQRIAWASNRDGNWDIYVMNADGSHVEQLTRDRFGSLYYLRNPDDTYPTFSPDGRKIAFDSGRNNVFETYVDHDLYTMSSDGTNILNLTD